MAVHAIAFPLRINVGNMKTNRLTNSRSPEPQQSNTSQGTMQRMLPYGRSSVFGAMLGHLWKRVARPDRRQKFFDLSKLPAKKRTPRSAIIQFYSSAQNIGNYLPVLGIQRMLGQQPDVWCMHDRKIDFDYINGHYRCCIIGGAGLLHKCFEPFWKSFSRECKLPIIVWGVGGCFPDSGTAARTVFPDSEVDCGLARKVFGRCDLVNVRDDVTAEYYALRDVSITACPTLAYLRDYQRKPTVWSKGVLFSSHEELLLRHEIAEIERTLAHEVGLYKKTTNSQTPQHGLLDVLEQFAASSLVVTTRLHGAIVAYGFGIPYVAIARDEKIRAFNRLYGGGLSIEQCSCLAEAISNVTNGQTGGMACDPVLAFGERAAQWIAANTENTSR